jgi:hypothetical protein
MKKFNIVKSLVYNKWGADEQPLLKIHQMIILPTLRYGVAAAAYRSAPPTTLKTLDPKGKKRAGRVVAVCQTETVLHEVLDDIFG